MKKIVDEKGRLFGKISIIDLIVIVVVVALGAAIYMRFFTKTETSSVENDTFVYEVVIGEVRKPTTEKIKVGDKLYSTESGVMIGTITAVDVQDAMDDILMADGTYSYSPVKERYDIYLTVEAEGIVSDGRYFAGRTFEINVNDLIKVATKYCEVEANVWSIEK